MTGDGPARAQAWYAAGCRETDRGEYAAAAASFERALGIAPDWPEAHHNLGRALFELGRVDDAVRCFQRAALGDRPGLPRAMLAVVIAGSSADHQAVLDARRAWARDFLPPVAPGPPPRNASAGQPLKIGYLSSFFHRANWMKPVWALINNHDRSAVEIHLFADSPRWTGGDGYRAHPGDRVHGIADLTNEEAAAYIERCGIDVLVDLNAYSKPARLPILARRPAATVASWFNLYATSGMPGIDYVVGDHVVISPDEERFYTEHVLRVEGTYLAFEPPVEAPDVVDPPCATTGAITFGSLASQYKITPRVIDAWARILMGAASSTLVLRNAALSAPSVRRYLHDAFGEHGIARDRVRMLGPADHLEFLRTYAEIDVALDPFPYSGGTTTMEALWQGVPVLTFRGARWAARTSESILRAAGLPELVLDDLDDYVARAVQLATAEGSADHFIELRRCMRGRLRASDACNGEKLARSMESLYRVMHEERERRPLESSTSG